MNTFKYIFLVFACAAFASDCEKETVKFAKPQLVFSKEAGLRFQIGEGKTEKEKGRGRFLTKMAGPFWLREMNQVLKAVVENKKNVGIDQKFLDALNVNYQTFGLDPDSIPKTGPLLVPATHPICGLEGLTLINLIKRVRPDVKIVANEIMGIIPGFEEISIPVNVEGSSKERRKAVFEMAKELGEGHAVIYFPSAKITTSPHHPEPWSRSLSLLARRSGAQILPVYVRGRPGLFYRMVQGFIGDLKKSFYPVEILKRRNTTVELVLGEILSHETLKKFPNDEAATDFIRDQTYQLGQKKF